MAPRLAVLLMLCAAAAHARSNPGEALEEAARMFGAETNVAIPPVVEASTPPADAIQVEEGVVNFGYAEMVDKFEGLSRTVIGRNKKKRRIDTGVTPADRVDRGEIKYIVLHASGGATGKPGACEGSVSWLLKQKTAAHFMVCRDGRVYRMVKIENIANHVKNGAIDAASVGIETESGHPEARAPFLAADWAPDQVWRMYAAMAWLVRAIAKETDLPRDRAHIITHEEADRGIRDAHTDPGPFFDAATYPQFDARFPGQKLTPREFLMRLVGDDAPPRLLLSASSSMPDYVEIQDSLALSHVRVWRLDLAGKPKDLVKEWTAPAAGLPPDTLQIGVPLEPGSYRFVARDLVGNIGAAQVNVPQAGLGPASLAAVLGSLTELQ